MRREESRTSRTSCNRLHALLHMIYHSDPFVVQTKIRHLFDFYYKWKMESLTHIWAYFVRYSYALVATIYTFSTRTSKLYTCYSGKAFDLITQISKICFGNGKMWMITQISLHKMAVIREPLGWYVSIYLWKMRWNCAKLRNKAVTNKVWWYYMIHITMINMNCDEKILCKIKITLSWYSHK